MANKKSSHVENVNALFENIKEVASENIPETVWLTTAKKAALNKHLGWISALEGFINGLNSTNRLLKYPDSSPRKAMQRRYI